MVIDFNRPNAPSSGRVSVAGGERAEKSEPKAADLPKGVEQTTTNAGGETVRLSEAAQQLQQASEKLRDAPEVDQSRVERLKQAIADGSYQVDPKRLASKLLAFEADR